MRHMAEADGKPMDNLAYLMTSIKPVATQSSVLVSSSPWLNHPMLRDWIATQYLRRNGPDRLSASDTADGLIPLLAELRDPARVAALIAREKEINPRFRAWVEERFISQLTREDFAHYAPGTVGGIYCRYQVENNIQLNLAREMIEPKDDFDFMRFRFGQIHDYEHIVAGGGFDTLGEVFPYFVRLSSTFTHLSPDLALAFGDVYILGGFRLPLRSALNYPECFLSVLENMARAIRIGMHSEPVFMARFEDVLDLTPAQARESLGIRQAEDVDTTAMSRVFDDLEGAHSGVAHHSS
jgi:ubiquinone biosynthesis protein Coq4